MNSSYVSLWREKISRRGFNWSFFIILSAVVGISGFFIFTPALAVHETTVTVNPLYVQGNHTDTYTFGVTNGGPDSIYKIVITANSDFTIVGDPTCPSGWDASYTGTTAQCLTDAFGSDVLVSGGNIQMPFSATSPNPGTDTSYTWTVTTKDSNMGYELTNIDTKTLVDVTKPVTTDIGTSADWLSVASVEVTLTSVDEGAEVLETLYCVDTNDACEPNIVGTSVIISDEGKYYVRFRSVDNVGNAEDIQSADNTVKIDRTPPTITDNSPSGWQNVSVDVTLFPEDTPSGIKEVKYCEGAECDPSTDGSVLVFPYELPTYSIEEEVVVKYQAWDNAGNTSDIGSYTVSIDKTSPTAGVSEAPADWTKETQIVSVTCSDEAGTVNSGCDESSYKYEIHTSDPSGVCSVNETDYDASASVDITQYSWVCSYVKDNAGNEDFSDNPVEFKVDQTPPTGQLNGVPDNWQNTNAHISLTYDDMGGSGINTKFLDVVLFGENCDPTTVYNGEVIEVTQHSTACWKVTDNAGNVTTDDAEILVDKTVPTSEIISPDAGSWFNNDFNVSITDVDKGGSELNVCSYEVNDEGWATRNCNEQITITVGASKDCAIEGVNTCQITVKSTDVATNQSTEAARTFSIDWTNPTGEITSPTNTVYKTAGLGELGNINLTFTALDPGLGTALQYAYKIDNEEYTTPVAYETGVGPTTVTISGLSDGRHTLQLKIIDAAGNDTESETISFVIDNNNTLTVAKTENPDFDTIQAAIVGASDNDIISIAAGNYNESITVDKTLSIIGAGDTTIISPDQDSDGIVITANNVLIKDLKVVTSNSGGIDDDPNIAINIQGTDGVTITGTTIETTGNKALGIWIGTSASTNLSILGNTITINNESTGIYGAKVSPAHSGWIIGGLDNANTITAYSNPVELYDVSNSEVSHNSLTITGGVGSNVIWSSEMSDLSNLIFNYNTVDYSGGSQVAFLTDFQNSLGTGFAPDTTISTVTITGNTFSNWGSRALRIGDGDGSDSGTVTGVSITSNTFNISSASEVIGGTDAGAATISGNVLNVTSGNSIQNAIDVAGAGYNVINVALGTYNEKLDLKGKSLDIIGAGSALTIIDASSLVGYAISNFGDSSTIKDLKLVGTGNLNSSYGFKVSGVSNITLENIKVVDSYKTGIDLNTVSNATLNNIEVTGTVRGFGLMMLDSNNVNVTDITTSNNAWGGVSIQTKNAISDSITFSGTFNVGDNFPLLLEKDPSTYYNITNVQIPGKFNYVVYDFREGDDYKQWYYFETLDSAKVVAQAFVADPVYSDVVIYDIAEKNYYVEEGMLIQDAIDAATSGDTINVAAGTYNENVNIRKSVHLIGAGSGSTIIAPVSGNSISIRDSDFGNINGVHIEGFTLEGVAGQITLLALSGGGNLPASSAYTTDLTITDVVINDMVGSSHGIGLNSVNDVTLTNVQVNNVKGDGIKAIELTGVRNLVITDSLFENNDVAVRVQGGFDDTLGYGPNGPITITNSRFNNNVLAVEITNSDIVIDAELNWWGTPTESEIKAMISGDDNVDYDCWYLDSDKTKTSCEVILDKVYVYTNTSLCKKSNNDEYTGFNCFSNIQDGIDAVNDNGTVYVAMGNYTTIGQVLIDKNLTIAGIDDIKPTISPSVDLLTTNNVAGAWFLVNADATFNLNNVVLNGNGKKVYQGVRSHGTTVINSVDFLNIRDNTAPYIGFAITSFGGIIPGGAGSDTHGSSGATSVLTVTDSTFAQIGRIGVLIKGNDSTATISGNTYTGKGDGNFLDYAFEVGAGGSATIENNNTISNNRGIATTDGSTSAGILVTDYYGIGTTADIIGNTITNCTDAIAVGYSETDNSVVTAHSNKFSGNDYGVNSTGPNVDAEFNWWNTITETTGPHHSTNAGGEGDQVGNNDDFRPWCTEETCTDSDPYAPSVVSNSQTPPDGAVGVSLLPEVSLVFSEKIQCGAGDWSECFLIDLVDGTPAYNDNTLTFGPTDNLDYNTEYTVSLISLGKIIDQAGNFLDLGEINSWSFITLTHYSIPLEVGTSGVGWNLISIPTMPSDGTAIENVLGSAKDNIESVWQYDAGAAEGEEWKVYRPVGESNLTTMEPGYGYWIDAKTDTVITGEGSLFGSQGTPNTSMPSVNLFNSWNLIGYYQRAGNEDAPISSALSTINGKYNTDDLITYVNGFSKLLNSNSMISPGSAFWAFLTENTPYAPGSKYTQ